MKPWQSLTVVFANALVLAMIGSANAPMSVNPDPVIINGLINKGQWAAARFNASLEKAIAKQEARLAARSEGQEHTDFCQPEFAPVPLAAFSELPDPRTEEQIIDIFGQPCHSDNERIYYLLTSGDVVHFSKLTGKGGFQS